MLVRYLFIVFIILLGIIFTIYFISSIKKLKDIISAQMIKTDEGFLLNWKYYNYDFPITYYVFIQVDNNPVTSFTTIEKKMLLKITGNRIIYNIVATGGKYQDSNIFNGEYVL